MTNNYIIRRTRYIFSISDAKIVEMFANVGMEVTKEQVKGWTRRDEDPERVDMRDSYLALFLNSFINEKRGKKEGPQPIPEVKLNNNIILRKFKIALNLRDDDMMEIFQLSHTSISKPELSSFFRKPEHRHFRYCKDQFMRNFMHGLQAEYRPDN